MSNSNVPIRSTAPEALRDGIFTLKSDVFSYYVVLWEVCNFEKIMFYFLIRYLSLEQVLNFNAT